MGKKSDLYKEFMGIINNLPGKRSELINLIAEELCIERESAYRRLSGRVAFSVKEVGVLAKRLNISLDDILQDNPLYKMVPIMMARPMTRLYSMDAIVKQMEIGLQNVNSSLGEEMELYSVFDSMPVEFFAPYPNLTKFMFFKWGYHYIGSEEFYSYEKWVLPEKVVRLVKDMLEACKNYSKMFYIWDYPTIWYLVNDISYFHNIHVLSDEDMEAVKSDLRILLYNLERVLKGIDKYSNGPVDLDVYLSTVNIGINCLAHFSQSNCHSMFKNHFFQTATMNSYESTEKVRDWILSMKILCTKISESSELERRLFFERQIRMID